MDEAYIGSIVLFAGTFAPQGWFDCSGQLLPINQYQALFSILGTTYGGNGSTTFGLPDLRGRVPVGATGQGTGLTNRQLGQTFGTESVTLTAAQMPAHTHAIQGEVKVGVADQEGNASAAPNSVLGSRALETSVSPPTRIEVYVAGGAATFNSGNKLGAVSHNLAAAAVGSNQPTSIVQPSLGLRYIICANGLYPSRP